MRTDGGGSPARGRPKIDEPGSAVLCLRGCNLDLWPWGWGLGVIGMFVSNCQWWRYGGGAGRIFFVGSSSVGKKQR